MPALTLSAALHGIREMLSASGIHNAAQEAMWLAQFVLSATSAEIIAYGARPLTAQKAADLEAAARRRASGEPLQYILGTAPFYGRDFRVGPGVLIPRADTETLIEAALGLFGPDEDFTFLDWGTGSGCIALTILLERPKSRAFMAEKNPDSVEIAEANTAALRLGDRAEIIRTETPDDIVLRRRCDLVISNPPYIPTAEIDGLMREVRDHEPRLALDGGADGMDVYRSLIANAPRWLCPGGYLVFESGSTDQTEELRRIMPKNFIFLQNITDCGKVPRCAVWQYLG